MKILLENIPLCNFVKQKSSRAVYGLSEKKVIKFILVVA